MRRGITTTYRKSTVAPTVGDLATFSQPSLFQQMLQVPPARTCNSLPKAHPWRWWVEVWGVDASGNQPLLGSRDRISGLVGKAKLFPTHTPRVTQEDWAPVSNSNNLPNNTPFISCLSFSLTSLTPLSFLTSSEQHLLVGPHPKPSDVDALKHEPKI